MDILHPNYSPNPRTENVLGHQVDGHEQCWNLPGHHGARHTRLFAWVQVVPSIRVRVRVRVVVVPSFAWVVVVPSVSGT